VRQSKRSRSDNRAELNFAAWGALHKQWLLGTVSDPLAAFGRAPVRGRIGVSITLAYLSPLQRGRWPLHVSNGERD
jgi:hypothetical protein